MLKKCYPWSILEKQRSHGIKPSPPYERYNKGLLPKAKATCDTLVPKPEIEKILKEIFYCKIIAALNKDRIDELESKCREMAPTQKYIHLVQGLTNQNKKL